MRCLLMEELGLLLLEEESFQNEFEDLSIDLRANPLGDLVFTYKVTVKNPQHRVLIPVAGFKYEFGTIGNIPFPLAIRAKRVDAEVYSVEAKDLKDGETKRDIQYEMHRLEDGNQGILIALPPKDTKFQLTVIFGLRQFTRYDPFSTEFVIGVFPPWGWKSGELVLHLNAYLLAPTLSHKIAIGIHDSVTGARKRNPKLSNCYRVRNRIRASVEIEELTQKEEIDIRVRASRIPWITPAPIITSLLWGLVGAAILLFPIVAIIQFFV